MNKIAIVVLADSDVPEGRGRMAHALQLAKAAQDGGQDVTLVFEGIGVKWLEAFHKRDHPFTQNYGPVFDAVKDNVRGACDFCSKTRFGVGDALAEAGFTFLGGEGQHYTMKELLDEGRQIITF